MLKYTSIIYFILCINSLLTASDWQRMHGKFVSVEYNPGFEELADSLVDIADNSIPRLSALHGVDLSEFQENKVRIILTDAPDISNGYAISDAIVIFARSSMYMENWSGPFSWYQQVMEHEMVHHITFRAIKRTSAFLGLVTSVTAPRWFMEGIAQYFSESWTMFRGDIYLKEAVLNGRFKYDALNSLEDGRLLYAAGHAYVRYLADQYGDSSLIKLVSYNKDGWFYDFDEAFQAVYDKSPASLFPFFHRHLIIYYGNQAADYPVIDLAKTLPSFGYRDLQVIPLTEKDSTYLVSTVKKENHLYKTALIADISQGKMHITDYISDNFSTRLIISPDQQKIAFGRFSFRTQMNQELINYDWYIYDMNSKKTEKLVTGIRARNAAFDYSGNIYLAVTEADTCIIRQFSSGSVKDIFKTEMPIGKIVIDSSNSIIFEAQLKNNQRDFFKLENNILSNISSDTTENRNPVLINNRYIAENRILNNQPAIALSDQKSGRSEVLINPQSALWLEDYDAKRNNLIVKASDALGKTHFAELSLDSLRIKPLLPDAKDLKPYYSGWISKKAKPDSIEAIPKTEANYKTSESLSFPQGDLINLQTLPFVWYDDKNGPVMFFSTTWMEALQRQFVNLNAFIYTQNWKESFVSLAHQLKVFSTDLQTFYYHGPVLFSRVGGDIIDLTHDYGMVSMVYNRYLGGDKRLPYSAAVAYSIDAVENKSLIDYSYHGAGLNLSAGYELPSSYRYVFARRAIRADISYFNSFRESWNFSTFNAGLYASTNLIVERLGLETTMKYTRIKGTASPSAVTGIDQDYEYNVPRDFRNTQTIRGVDKDIFGNRLLWGTVELKYFLAEQTPLKLLFIPVNELAVSVFADGAMISSSETIVSSDVYSYGSELSFGFDIIRFSAGVARGTLNGSVLKTQFYGRLNIKIIDLM